MPSIPANASGMLRLDTVLSCLFSSATMVEHSLQCFEECVSAMRSRLPPGRSLAYKGSPAKKKLLIWTLPKWGEGP